MHFAHPAKCNPDNNCLFVDAWIAQNHFGKMERIGAAVYPFTSCLCTQGWWRDKFSNHATLGGLKDFRLLTGSFIDHSWLGRLFPTNTPGRSLKVLWPMLSVHRGFDKYSPSGGWRVQMILPASRLRKVLLQRYLGTDKRPWIVKPIDQREIICRWYRWM